MRTGSWASVGATAARASAPAAIHFARDCSFIGFVLRWSFSTASGRYVGAGLQPIADSMVDGPGGGHNRSFRPPGKPCRPPKNNGARAVTARAPPGQPTSASLDVAVGPVRAIRTVALVDLLVVGDFVREDGALQLRRVPV